MWPKEKPCQDALQLFTFRLLRLEKAGCEVEALSAYNRYKSGFQDRPVLQHRGGPLPTADGSALPHQVLNTSKEGGFPAPLSPAHCTMLLLRKLYLMPKEINLYTFARNKLMIQSDGSKII